MDAQQIGMGNLLSNSYLFTHLAVTEQYYKSLESRLFPSNKYESNIEAVFGPHELLMGMSRSFTFSSKVEDQYQPHICLFNMKL